MGYNRILLIRGLTPETMYIRGWDETTLLMQRLALSCDSRIPAECGGYVSQIIDANATIAVRTDAVSRLSRFVEWDN